MTEYRAGMVVVGAVGIVLLVGLLGGSGIGAAASPQSQESLHVAGDIDGVPLAVVQDDSDENDSDGNETDPPPHRHPDEYDEHGDLDGVEAWLTEQMVGSLGEGAIQLSEGEYDRASDYVDEEYRDHLSRYVEVAEETEGEGQAETFESAGEEQARTTNSVREYRETKAEYESAQDRGDDEEARELARELEDLARTVNDSSGSLRDHYDDLESEVDEDMTEPAAEIEQVNEEIQREQEAVRETTFVETELLIDADRDPISFLDPLTATGLLRTADGDPVANETIRLEVGDRAVRAETNADGLFDFVYRPTTVPLSTDRLEIRYDPDGSSAYLGSETAVDVSIEQVEPTISSLEASEDVTYGDSLTVEGDLHVDGTPVGEVPLDVTLGDERLGAVEPENGSFSGTGTVPASVADGDRNLDVRLDFEGESEDESGSEGESEGETGDGTPGGDEPRALAETNTTTTVTVLETESALSFEAARADDGAENRTVETNGTLETVDGDGVAGETVHLRTDGTTLETVTTDADGSFSAAAEVPNSVAEGDVRLVAAYDGTESNVESARANTVVTFPSPTDAQPWWLLPAWAWLGLGGLAVIGVGTTAWWYRSRSRRTAGGEPSVATESERGSGSGDGPADEPPSDTARDTVSRTLLERASDHLSSGRPNEAVETGYAAIRHTLGTEVDDGETLTHWEFYRRFQRPGPEAAGTDVDDDLLRTVTQQYERATFDAVDVSSDGAKDVLECARRLCEQGWEGSSGSSDGDGDGRPADD